MIFQHQRSALSRRQRGSFYMYSFLDLSQMHNMKRKFLDTVEFRLSIWEQAFARLQSLTSRTEEACFVRYPRPKFGASRDTRPSVVGSAPPLLSFAGVVTLRVTDDPVSLSLVTRFETRGRLLTLGKALVKLVRRTPRSIGRPSQNALTSPSYRSSTSTRTLQSLSSHP